jgi:hypothetical protein
MVHCDDATASSFVAKVWDKVFTQFNATTVKHDSMRKDCLACQDEFFANNPLDVKGK